MKLTETPLTFEQIYRNLDGMIALQVATETPLRKQKDERDTAFVKRIVATYVEIAGRAALGAQERANSSGSEGRNVDILHNR